jgi:hypothetical protein
MSSKSWGSPDLSPGIENLFHVMELNGQIRNPLISMNLCSRTDDGLSAKDEKREELPSRVIWDDSLDHFEEFRNTVEGRYGKIGACYLSEMDFQKAYLEKGGDCFVDFLDDIHSASQIKKDVGALYVALLSACQSSVGQMVLMGK